MCVSSSSARAYQRGNAMHAGPAAAAVAVVLLTRRRTTPAQEEEEQARQQQSEWEHEGRGECLYVCVRVCVCARASGSRLDSVQQPWSTTAAAAVLLTNARSHTHTHTLTATHQPLYLSSLLHSQPCCCIATGAAVSARSMPALIPLFSGFFSLSLLRCRRSSISRNTVGESEGESTLARHSRRVARQAVSKAVSW